MRDRVKAKVLDDYVEEYNRILTAATVEMQITYNKLKEEFEKMHLYEIMYFPPLYVALIQSFTIKPPQDEFSWIDLDSEDNILVESYVHFQDSTTVEKLDQSISKRMIAMFEEIAESGRFIPDNDNFDPRKFVE